MIFPPTSPEKIAAQQLYEAERMQLEHRAAAEYHETMARMYEARIARLKAVAAAKDAP